MMRFIKHNRVWRFIILALLIAAITGPWTYDLVNVPSAYPFSAPFIRLQGDFCGLPLSGTYILQAVDLESVNKVVELFTGAANINNVGRWFQIPTGTLLLLLPIVSTLVLILRKNQNHRKVYHLVIWSLASISCLSWSLILPDEWRLSPLWGFWLYVGLAASSWYWRQSWPARKSSASLAYSQINDRLGFLRWVSIYSNTHRHYAQN